MHDKQKLFTFALAVATALIVGGASVALAALNFSATGITGDGNVVIDSPGTISIGTSTATGVTIGSPSSTVSFPGNVTVGSTVVTRTISFSQATAPTVTPTCSGTCATTYGYEVIDWSQGFFSIVSAETQVSNAATLDASHYNVISHTCQPGAAFYTVERTTGGTTQGQIGAANDGPQDFNGKIGSGAVPISCLGGTLKDDGLNGTGNSGETGFYDMSRGAFTGSLVVGDDGDVAKPQLYVGTPDYAAGTASDGEYGQLAAVQYYGTTANRNIGLGVNFEGTDGAQNISGIVTVAGSDVGLNNTIIGDFAAVRNFSASVPLAEADAFSGTIDQNSGGGITLAKSFSALLEAGATEYHAFDAPNATDATTAYSYYTAQNAGSGKWAFYGAGTAPSKLGSPTGFASLPTCASGIEGAQAPVNDSATSTLGAIVTGSGSNHVLAYCDGTNWTVMAK